MLRATGSWTVASDPMPTFRQHSQPICSRWSMGGLRWPDGTVLRTFTIVTTDANKMIAELHDRMPVFLAAADWPVWLGEAEGDPAALLKPTGEDILKIRPVSRRVNSRKSNSPELLEAVG